MKTINEYISNKITNSDVLYDGFPKTPKLQDVIDFLEDHGFIKMRSYDYDHAFLDDIEDDRYIVQESTWHAKKEYWVRFCKAGKPSAKNPIYFCRLTETGKQVSDDDDMAYVEYYFDNNGDDKTFENYKEFVDYVNTELNWQ